MDLFNLTLRDYLRLLEKLASKNTDQMKLNNDLFNQKSGENLSAKEKSDFLSTLLKKNSKISAENKKLRDIHARIIEFMHEYKNGLNIETETPTENIIENNSIPVIKIEKEMSKKECFNKTLKGEIPINNTHPYIKDSDFINSLITHFSKSEDYEKCAELIKYK